MAVGFVKRTIAQDAVPRLSHNSQNHPDDGQNVRCGEELRRGRWMSCLSHTHVTLPRCSASTASASFMPAERVQKRICAGLMR